MQKGGRKRKKKCICVCIADFLAYCIFPSLARGRLGLGKGHGMATQALACACIIVSIQLFYFFLYFSARSLFIAGGCLASLVSLYTCTHVLIVLCTVVAFIRLFGWLAGLGFSRRCDDHGWDGLGWVIEFELNA